MGSIQKREDRPGYIARWRDPDGNRRSKSFAKGEAVRFVTKTEADKMEGNCLDPRRARMTVATWAEQFRELRARKRPGTVEREGTSLRAHVLPALGNRAMGSIRRPDSRGTWTPCRRRWRPRRSAGSTGCSTSSSRRQWTWTRR
jgi:hypothetical protein